MKVGDYVRTKMGISKCIKVISIKENSFMYEFDKEVYEEVKFLTASELEKYKISDKIINLIETGDYVNGNKVLEKENCLLWLFDNDKHDTLYLKEEDIKSIVTKEQFESMEYKVVE